MRAAIEEANALPGADTIEFSFASLLTDPDPIVLSADQGALPLITETLTLAGNTAPGYNGFDEALEDSPPIVYIDGRNVTGDGLRFAAGASNSIVWAIGIVNFSGDGIELATDANSISIQGNYIGVEADGTTAGNENGIFIRGNNNNIGTTFLFNVPFLVGNVISGNSQSGIVLSLGSGNRIAGNRIGTLPNGIGSRSNNVGISGLANDNSIGIFNDDNVIGNIISGNTAQGINILGGQTTIVGNRIGVSNVCNSSPNGGNGISLLGAGNTVGGDREALGNIVANNDSGIVVNGLGGTAIVRNNRVGFPTLTQGHTGDGIVLTNVDGGTVADNLVNFSVGNGILLEGDTENTSVTNNIVGVDFLISGSNGNDVGIRIEGDSNAITGNLVGNSDGDGIKVLGDGNSFGFNLVGTNVPNAFGVNVPNVGEDVGNGFDGLSIDDSASDNVAGFNVFANNGESGVEIRTGTQLNNTVFFNSYRDNGQLGIDLGIVGPNANDALDADTGSNKLQNYPEILNAEIVDVAGDPMIQVTWQINSGSGNSAYPITAAFYYADDAMSGEGAFILGDDDVGSPNTPTVTLLSIPDAVGSSFVVATATDNDGNTSEFSPAISLGDIIFTDGFESGFGF